jgi:transposase
MAAYLRRFERIFAHREGVDMRRGAEGLLCIVKREFRADPFSGCLFFFMNRQRNLAKCIFWDRTGWVVIAKRLERGKYKIPHSELSYSQFLLVMDGVL